MANKSTMPTSASRGVPTSRRFRLAAAATAATLTLAACSTGNEEPTTGEAGEPAGECVIGMTTVNLTAIYFQQMNEGAQAAADEAGCELQIANANNDSAKQSSDIENFVSQAVTGLIVVAIDVNGVLPALEQATSQGVRTVAVNAPLKEGAVDTFVGADNEESGAKAGQWVVDEGLADGASYGVVDARSSTIQAQREDGFREVVDTAGAAFTQAVDGENVQEEAATAAQNLVTAQPNLDFVYTTGEPATVGAVAALDPTGDTKVIGWDLTAEVIAGIDSGLVTAVVQQDPRQEGIEAVNELAAVLEGEEPAGYIDVPVTIVTAENVDPYREIFQ